MQRTPTERPRTPRSQALLSLRNDRSRTKLTQPMQSSHRRAIGEQTTAFAQPRAHAWPHAHQDAGAMMMNFIRSDPLSEGIIRHR